MHLKWFLPKYVLIIASNKLLWVGWMLQKPYFASHLEYIFVPANLYVIFSSVCFVVLADYGSV